MSDAANSVIASLHHSGIGLDLKTVDLCFLIALHARANRSGLTCFEEEVLLDVFQQVCDAVEADADNLAKRATHAIQRLRDQRLLARVDGAGMVRAGEYALTRLASGIVEFFLADEVLTRESLALLTKTLLASLAEVKSAAKKAETPDDWRLQVMGPLRVTVSDLVAGIERRQRGLDVQQEGVQQQIGELLQADWFRAVDQCESLLDQTAKTLEELNTILLRDTHQIHAVLTDTEQLASTAGMQDAEEAVLRVAEQVDHVAAWGQARQRAWSEYYQYVHRFLRDVVRLDPDRALSERLRNQLSTWASRPFSLMVSHAAPIRLLRESNARVIRPPVVRPSKDREAVLEAVESDSEFAALENRVRAAVAAGKSTFSGVLEEVLPEIPQVKRFVSVGRVAAQLSEEAEPRSARERPWASVPGGIEVEEWELSGRDKP